MNNEVDKPAPGYRKACGSGYHGTTPERAEVILKCNEIHGSQVVEARKFNPWFGRGVYLYVDGIYLGADSARHYVEVIRGSVGKGEAVVIEAEYEAKRLLDLTDAENYRFLMEELYDEVVNRAGLVVEESVGSEGGKFLPEGVTPRDVVAVWTGLDPDIDGVTAASFEGEGVGLQNPLQGNFLLDVQKILCLLSPKSVKSLKIHTNDEPEGKPTA